MCIGTQELWNLEFSAKDLFVQIGCIWIFKRQVSTNKRIKDDTTAPDVNLGSKIALACNHLRSCVAWGATGCLECLTIFVCIAQAKINNFDIFIMGQKQILRLQIPMDDLQLMQVLHSSDDLVEEVASLWLLHPLIGHDVIEELTTLSIFHYQIQLLGCLNDFIQLYDIRVSYHLQYMNLSRHSLHIVHILNLILLQNLDSNLFTGEVMHAQLDFTKGSFSNSFAQDVLPYVCAASLLIALFGIRYAWGCSFALLMLRICCFLLILISHFKI